MTALGCLVAGLAACSSNPSDGGSAAAGATSAPTAVAADDGSTTFTGTAQEAEFIADMKLNGYWPDIPAETLIGFAEKLCEAYDAGGDRDSLGTLMEAAGIPGEDTVYLNVLVTANYCPEHGA